MKPFSGRVDDGCPQWAQLLIEEIRVIETKLGNIPSGAECHGDDIEDRAALASSDSAMAETLFERLVLGLTREKHNPEVIAKFVNSRVGYQGGPPYCSIEEIFEILARA